MNVLVKMSGLHSSPKETQPLLPVSGWVTATKAQLRRVYTEPGVYLVHLTGTCEGAAKCRGEAPSLGLARTLPVVSVCLVLASELRQAPPGRGPQQLPAHTAPHVPSPSPVSTKKSKNSYQRTGSGCWSDGHKPCPAQNTCGTMHRRGRDQVTRKPAVDVLQHESIVIILRAILCRRTGRHRS